MWPSTYIYSRKRRVEEETDKKKAEKKSSYTAKKWEEDMERED